VSDPLSAPEAETQPLSAQEWTSVTEETQELTSTEPTRHRPDRSQHALGRAAVPFSWLCAAALYGAGHAVAWWLTQEPTVRPEMLAGAWLSQPVSPTPTSLLFALVGLAVFVAALLALSGSGLATPVWAAATVALLLTNPAMVDLVAGDQAGQLAQVLSMSVVVLSYSVLWRIGTTPPARARGYWILVLGAAGGLAASLWAGATAALALPAAAAVYRATARPAWRPWLMLLEFPAVVLGAAAIHLIITMAVLAISAAWSEEAIGLLPALSATGSQWAWHLDGPALGVRSANIALHLCPYLFVTFAGAALLRFGDLIVTPLAHIVGQPRSPEAEPWGAKPVDFVVLGGLGVGAGAILSETLGASTHDTTLLPFLVIGTVYLPSRFVRQVDWWEVPVYSVVLAGMAGYFVSFVGDGGSLYRREEGLLPLVVWPASLGLAFLALGATLGKRSLARQLTILGVFLVIAWGWGANLSHLEWRALTADGGSARLAGVEQSGSQR
jgi:hypothetical protein